MAFRSDISIDWTTSPRIITVASPSTELTMQDLHDTLVDLEDELINMSRIRIVKSSGKEPLGGTEKVGITLTLLDAKVAFTARPGPDWVECQLIGGNCVAFESDGVTVMSAVEPTAYVSVTKTASSSATLQEQDALRYASYGGVVSIDATNGESGTSYPIGNMEYPVNNIPDAMTIAVDKGFSIIRIIGNLTLGSGDDVSDMKLMGTNPMTSVLTVLDAAVTDNIFVEEVYFTGTLDGGTILRNCILGEVHYFNGYIEYCALTSNTIYVNGSAVLINCAAGATCTSDPIIDLTNITSLAVRDFQGSFVVKNKTVDATCEVNLNGRLTIDSTVVAGTLTVYGDGHVVNNGTGSSTLVDRTTGSVTEIALAVKDSVWTSSPGSYLTQAMMTAVAVSANKNKR